MIDTFGERFGYDVASVRIVLCRRMLIDPKNERNSWCLKVAAVAKGARLGQRGSSAPASALSRPAVC